MNLTNANPALFAALAKAQAEVENATKGSTNPHFRSKYADLAEVLNTVRPTFAKYGLSIMQSTGFNGELVTVSTAVAHAEGGYVVSDASCIPAKADAQGIGAATTYLWRYGLAAMTGIAQEDDDGQSARHERPPNDPRPAPAKAIDAAKVAAGVEAVQEVMAADLDEVAQCLALYDLHLEFSKDSDLYIAISDALAAGKVISKANWKAAIAAAKKAA